MAETAAPPARAAVRAPGFALGAGGCVVLWSLVALAGPSAAVPDLGAGFGAFDLGLGWSSATVSVLMACSASAGGVGLLLGLRALARGWRPRRLLPLGLLIGLLVTFLPPSGSADHVSYAAYGRIAALGGDPYSQPPDTFAGGQDPVAGAVRDPWRSTTSVYGPVAGLLMSTTSALGGDSVRATVWCWQLALLLVWAAAAFGIRRCVSDPQRRARAELLWTANPLLLTIGLAGAHMDVLAGSAAVGCLLLARRYPFAAGVALAVAVGTKLPYGAVALGVLVAAVTTRRFTPGWLLRGALGALLVLVPAHLWAGEHVYDQTRTASRYVSLATIWRPLVDEGYSRDHLLPGMVVVMAVVALVWWSVLVRGGFVERAAGVTAVLAMGYLLGTAYELPWYDVLLWGPLALAVVPAAGRGAVAVRLLVAVLVARFAALAVAYVPGLVDGMSPEVEAVTMGFRREVGPWISWGALIAVIVVRSVPRLTVGRR